MRYYKYLYMLCIVAVGFSCSQENELEFENAPINNTSTSKITTTPNNLASDPFEDQLQWVSFITANVILNKPDAREEFIAQIGRVDPDVVKLEDILVDRSAFETAFKQQFLFYNGITDDRCSGGTKDPKGNPKPPGAIGGCPEDSCLSNLYEEYIEYLIEQNCIEIYIPNGYTMTTIMIHSTAHPLTNDGFNEAYIVPEQCDGEFIISPFNINSLNNVLIARPYRGNDAACSYSEYSHITNFTDFLDN